MATVHKILEKKGKTPYTIQSSILVYDALREMVEKNVGALIVMEAGAFKGVFSERDYARKVMLKGKSSRDTYVYEILDEECITIAPATEIKDCMNLMTENSIRYLPVLENTVLVGIISIGDVVKYIIEDQQYTLRQLESYISQ